NYFHASNANMRRDLNAERSRVESNSVWIQLQLLAMHHGLRGEIQQVRNDLGTEIQQVRNDLQQACNYFGAELQQVRDELQGMRDEFQELRAIIVSRYPTKRRCSLFFLLSIGTVSNLGTPACA